MKTTGMLIVLCLVCGMLIIGCGSETKKPVSSNTFDEDQFNKKAVDTYSDLAIQNAIIAQHTLYPYHFVNNSANLNGVGERDIMVLIQHFLANPGQLNLQKGSADDALYKARKELVYEKLVQAGIPQEKISITDGLPGGDGVPSTTVIEILEKAKEKPDMGDSQQNYGGMQLQL